MSNQISNKSLFRDARIFVLIIVLLPFWMWLFWLLKPKTHKNIVIVDKTVLNNYQEHNSLIWILQHEKFINPNGDFYKSDINYFGFFPGDSGRYRIKGLERFGQDKIDQLVNDCDFTYFTDTYGIYTQEWRKHEVLGDRSSLIYGGLSKQDLDFLKGMKRAGKLILTEFNLIGSPTDELIRNEFEKGFGLQWSGWNGRYFSSFDTTKNPELPRWLINDYNRDHQQKWPFKKDGIALVNNKEEVIVLERGSGLGEDVYPHIKPTTNTKTHFGLPADMAYAYWFDIMFFDKSQNEAIASYHIPVTDSGKALLAAHQLPNEFPAIIRSIDPEKPFYYLSGDFTDNPIDMKTTKFSGVPIYKWMLFDKSNPLDRPGFFWDFYRPLVSTILKDEVKRKN